MASANDTKIEEVCFQPGELIFKERNPGDHFFIIKEGQVQVFKQKGEQQIPLAVIHSGQNLGELSVMDGMPRSATAVALTEVRALKISREAIQRQMKKLPHWFGNLVFNLVERMRKTDDILRKNSLIDEDLMNAIQAIEFKVSGASKENLRSKPDSEASIQEERQIEAGTIINSELAPDHGKDES
jgi:CRP-like cAMP-binding protein